MAFRKAPLMHRQSYLPKTLLIQPPCWRRTRYWKAAPAGFQTLTHSSGPSSVACSCFIRENSVLKICNHVFLSLFNAFILMSFVKGRSGNVLYVPGHFIQDDASGLVY